MKGTEEAELDWEVVTSGALEIGGPRVRAAAAGVCRAWRRIAEDWRSWRREYEARWWHQGLEDGGWRIRFAKRMCAEQELARAVYEVCADDAVRDDSSAGSIARKARAVSVEEAASSEFDVREMAASVGALAGCAYSRAQFEALRMFRAPPTLESRRAFVELAHPALAESLRRDSVVAAYAGAALVTACAARADWTVARKRGTLDAGLVVVASCLRVFYDGEGVEAELDRLAASARGGVEAVFRQEAFVGNATEYYAVENSLIDSVLATRSGIPISLSAVFLAVAERAGVEPGRLRPVNAPGHFLLEDCADGSFLDVFDNLTRFESPDEVVAFLSDHNGLSPEHLRPLLAQHPTPHDLWRRVLRNVVHVAETSATRTPFSSPSRSTSPSTITTPRTPCSIALAPPSPFAPTRPFSCPTPFDATRNDSTPPSKTPLPTTSASPISPYTASPRTPFRPTSPSPPTIIDVDLRDKDRRRRRGLTPREPHSNYRP